MIGPYTQEKIRNLNDQKALSMIVIRLETMRIFWEELQFVYKLKFWQMLPRSRKPRLPKDDLNVFAYTRQNSTL